MNKIAAIAALEDGWLGAGTLAPSEGIVNWVAQHASLIADAPVPTSIIPDAEGFISLVWEKTNREFTAEIHEYDALLIIDHLDSDEIEERVMHRQWADIHSAMVAEA